jgi:Cft2 family RNA processing exonuclease
VLRVCCCGAFFLLKSARCFVQTTFKGRVFMTHATKAIYKLLLSDYVKVSKVSVEDMLYDESDIARSMDKIEVRYNLIAVPLPVWL